MVDSSGSVKERYIEKKDSTYSQELDFEIIPEIKLQEKHITKAQNEFTSLVLENIYMIFEPIEFPKATDVIDSIADFLQRLVNCAGKFTIAIGMLPFLLINHKVRPFAKMLLQSALKDLLMVILSIILNPLRLISQIFLRSAFFCKDRALNMLRHIAAFSRSIDSTPKLHDETIARNPDKELEIKQDLMRQDHLSMEAIKAKELAQELYRDLEHEKNPRQEELKKEAEKELVNKQEEQEKHHNLEKINLDKGKKQQDRNLANMVFKEREIDESFSVFSAISKALSKTVLGSFTENVQNRAATKDQSISK